MGWYEFRNVHCRIYRPVRKVDQSKQVRAADFVDITGADIMARLDPESSQAIYVGASAHESVRGTLQLPRGTNIARGYLVEVFDLRTVAGVRGTVTATLTANATATDAALTVDAVTGFEAGMECVLNPASGNQFGFTVKAVDSTNLQLDLHGDELVPEAYVTGDTIAAKRVFLAESNIAPGMRGPYRVAVTQIPWGDWYS